VEQEDYIKRQIDQLGRALGKILADLMGLKARGQVNNGIESADQSIKNASGLNLDDLTSIPADRLIGALHDDRRWSVDNFEKLADILLFLAEEANSGDLDPDKKIKLSAKALILYEHVDVTSSTYSFDRHLKMEKIKKAV
jgi:hypothetical protein